MGRVLRLLLLDTKTGRVTDLFEGTTLELPRDDGGNEVFDVHPEGGRIAFVHDPAPVHEPRPVAAAPVVARHNPLRSGAS